LKAMQQSKSAQSRPCKFDRIINLLSQLWFV
jgi:hypothetical protein